MRRRSGRVDARGATGVGRRHRDQAEELVDGLEPAVQLQHDHTPTSTVELQRSEGRPVRAHLVERWHDLWVCAAAHRQGHVLVRPLTKDRVALIEDRTSAGHECIPGLPVPEHLLRHAVQRVGIAPLTRRVGRDDHCKQWVAVHA